MLCKVEQTLAVLRPPIVPLLHMLHETLPRRKVLVAQPAREWRKRNRIRIELTKLDMEIFRQRPVPCLLHRGSRLARGGGGSCSGPASAVCPRLRRHTCTARLAEPRFSHGKSESVGAVPGQAYVVVLGIPGAERALLLKPMRAAELDPVGAPGLALGKNGLVAPGAPHACAAPAAETGRVVQEHRWQPAIDCERVVGEQVHPYVPC